MAGSLASDSSRTLSADNTRKSTMNGGGGGPSPLLLQALSASPHDFLQPGSNLHDAALVMAKQYLDPLAAVFSGKEKQNQGEKKSDVLEKIYLEGFDVDQVWEQVKIVVDAVESGVGERKAVSPVGEELVNGKKRKAAHFDEDGGNSESESDSGAEDSLEYEQVPEDELDQEVPESDSDDEDEGGVRFPDEDDQIDIRSSADGEEVEALEDEEDEGGEEAEEAEEYTEDIHGLNDGFFSIDDFNRQTEFLELQDMRGGPENSDDEEEAIDYDQDPATLGGDEDEDDAPLKGKAAKDDYEESDDDLVGEDQENANDLMYEDFFAPPPRKASNRNRMPHEKKSWKQAPIKRSSKEGEGDFTAIKNDMDRVRRDLFDDDEENGSDIDMSADPSDPLSRRSSHEKRQAALTEQIRALEAANVAKREWTLSGEARANSRPLNSLLEEDLEFERSGKPVPVITQEVTEGLEDMIKRRILASDFDEVIRRRPDDVSGKVRRGRIELDDSKATEGLAEIYEKEHLRAIDPENNPTAKNEKLAKEHAEIEQLFAEVNRNLDSLTSWHYTPKPPKASLSIVADVAAISMEEAQPTAAAGGTLAANISMLAPQEVYAPHKGKAILPVGGGSGREIVTKGGAAISTREMTREDKQRRRRREKEKIRKKNATEGNKGGANAKEGSKKDVMDSLRKGGVKVIGKQGEQRNIDGGLVKEKARGNGSSGLKL